MNLYAGGRDRNRPEQATGDVPWIDRRHLRATLALVEIQSKQAESPFVLFPVNSDVVPLHEPHVSVKEKATGVTGTRVRSSPVARDMRHADEAVEVSNQGWLTAGSRKKEMEDFRSRAEGLDTSRNRVRSGAGGCPHQSRPPESGAEHPRRKHHTEGPGCLGDKLASGHRPLPEVRVTNGSMNVVALSHKTHHR